MPKKIKSAEKPLSLKKQEAREAVGHIEAGLNTVTFIAGTNKFERLGVLQQGIGKVATMSAGILFDSARLGFSIYDWLKAKNPNVNKLTSVVMNAFAVGIGLLTGLGGLLAAVTFGVAIPYIIIGWFGLNTLFQLGSAAKQGYKWYSYQKELKSNKNNAEKTEQLTLLSKAYKNDCINSLKSAGILGAFTVAFSLLMVFKVAPLIVSAASAALCGGMFLMGVGSAIKERFFDMPKREKNKKERKENTEYEDEVREDRINELAFDDFKLTQASKNTLSPTEEEKVVLTFSNSSQHAPTVTSSIAELHKNTLIEDYKNDAYYQKNRPDELFHSISPKQTSKETDIENSFQEINHKLNNRNLKPNANQQAEIKNSTKETEKKINDLDSEITVKKADIENYRRYLLKELTHKINELHREIKNQGFFDRFSKSRREAKLEVLCMLRLELLNDAERINLRNGLGKLIGEGQKKFDNNSEQGYIWKAYNALNDYKKINARTFDEFIERINEKNPNFKKQMDLVYRSFFKVKGDTHDLIDGVKKYFKYQNKLTHKSDDSQNNTLMQKKKSPK